MKSFNRFFLLFAALTALLASYAVAPANAAPKGKEKDIPGFSGTAPVRYDRP